MPLTVILINVSFPSPILAFIPNLNLTFLQILLTVAFLSSSGLTTLISQTVYFSSEHIRCYFLVFLFIHFLVVGSVR